MATTEFSKRPSVSESAAEPKLTSKTSPKETALLDTEDSVVDALYPTGEEAPAFGDALERERAVTASDLIIAFETHASQAAEVFQPLASNKTLASKLLRDLALLNRDDVIEAITAPL